MFSFFNFQRTWSCLLQLISLELLLRHRSFRPISSAQLLFLNQTVYTSDSLCKKRFQIFHSQEPFPFWLRTRELVCTTVLTMRISAEMLDFVTITNFFGIHVIINGVLVVPKAIIQNYICRHTLIF